MSKGSKKQKYIKPIIEGCDRPKRIRPIPQDDSWLAKPGIEAAYAWRIIKTTIEEIESKPIWSEHDDPLSPEYKVWAKLKGILKPNDELWIYNSPKKFWNVGMGSCGILLVRKNAPIDMIVCRFN